MIKLTAAEKDRIAQIKAALRKFKRMGQDMSTWEATFFLKILDRNK